jgi:hypothetical protein
MARKVPQAELDAIVAVISRRSDGARVEDLLLEFPRMARRTLQDRLRKLVRENRLRREGAARSTRYFAAKATEHPMAGPPGPIAAEPSFLPPLSLAGAEIRHLVSKPIEERPPVSYDRTFLDDYIPGQTFYLSTDERARLLERGRGESPLAAAGTYAREILERLLIDLSWNSSRLEGNTYSLLDTERLIKLGKEAEGKDAREAVMILNHKAAIEFLVENAEDIDFNPRTIRNLHALLASELLSDPNAPGRLRRIPVGIGGSVYHPLSEPHAIEELFNELLQKASAIEDPFEQALFAMIQLPYLQPFDDVNKRVSRLAANIPFIKRNLAPVSFAELREETYVLGLLGVYELRRVELIRDVFLWAYERSASRYAAQRQSMGEPDPQRLRWRQALQDLIKSIIQDRQPRDAAAAQIHVYAVEHLPEAERARFIEMAEADLLGVNEGNFARYRVRPSEYYAWRQNWEAEE